MALPVLPPKYYLSHFFEWIDFLENHYRPVLETRHFDLLTDFRALPEDAQCLFVRMVNRKGLVFARDDFKKYVEIENYSASLAELEKFGFAGPVQSEHKADLLDFLTKPQLRHWLKQHNFDFSLNLSRQDLIAAGRAELEKLELSKLPIAGALITQRRTEEMDYLLFLYFGRIQQSLNLYTLRDLGIRKSGTLKTVYTARFTKLREAQAEYFFAKQLLQDFSKKSLSEINLLTGQIRRHENLAPSAQRLKDQLLLIIAENLMETDTATALDALNESQHAEARERAVRQLYKMGEKERCIHLLEDIQTNPRGIEELMFAEDFFARKFHRQKIGQLTKLLRDAREIVLSDAFLKKPEAGVREYYRAQGYTARFTENYLWTSLFGVLFWEELFVSEDAAIHNSFERAPSDLIGPDFYERHQTALEKKLALFKNSQSLGSLASAEQDPFPEFAPSNDDDSSRMSARSPKPAPIGPIEQLILKSITQHFGRLNGVFQWHPSLTGSLIHFLQASRSQNVAHVLRTMAKQFEFYRTGFPDLLVEKDGVIQFIEVKAEGDQIRSNQLAKMRLLMEAGFQVEVLRVRWEADPHQTYVVVDVETTGGSAGFHRVTEIGAVKMQNGNIIDEFQSLINPGRPIPSFITRITGITNAMVADAPPFGEVAERLFNFLEGSIFVAHNVRFDYGFIQREFARAGFEFVRPQLCTCAGMRKAFPGLPAYGLKSLTAHFGISLSTHHRAMCDARAAAELLRLMNSRRADMRENATSQRSEDSDSNTAVLLSVEEKKNAIF